MCVQCHRCEKAKGLQRCWECVTGREAPEVREQRADWRLSAVPEPLRVARVPEAQWPPGRRWCSGCQTFVRKADCNAGASRCKVCTGRTAHASMISRTYTIHGRPFTEDDYQELFKRQGGRCRTCGRPSVSKRLAIDHDHDTGEVRGLLCPSDEWGCNMIIGRIGTLKKARAIVEYLEDPPAGRWIKA